MCIYYSLIYTNTTTLLLNYCSKMNETKCITKIGRNIKQWNSGIANKQSCKPCSLYPYVTHILEGPIKQSHGWVMQKGSISIIGFFILYHLN